MLVRFQQLRQALTHILLLDCWEQSEGEERLKSPLFSMVGSKGKIAEAYRQQNNKSGVVNQSPGKSS